MNEVVDPIPGEPVWIVWVPVADAARRAVMGKSTLYRYIREGLVTSRIGSNGRKEVYLPEIVPHFRLQQLHLQAIGQPVRGSSQ